MLRANKLDSPGHARDYFKTDFANSEQRYYSQNQTVSGEFGGKLAEEWGLQGQVTEEQFSRLVEGQDPQTGEQLIRHLTPHQQTTADGKTQMTKEHVPGWDLTFSAPKSVSALAVYGTHEEVRDAVRDAHRTAVKTAMQSYEQYAMARMGGSKEPVVTGKLLTVSFEHDTARPEGGLASPQLHTHVIAMNMTQTEDGKVRSLQSEEMFKAQAFGRIVYRNELAYQLRSIGFEIDRGKYNEPEIRGISREFINDISYRRNDIDAREAATGHKGHRAREYHALQGRQSKQSIDPEKTDQAIRGAIQRHGLDLAKLEREALQRGPQLAPANEVRQQAAEALDYARDHNAERSATFRQDKLIADALDKGMGVIRRDDIEKQLEQRREMGEFVVRREARTSHVLTTAVAQRKEQEIITKMRQGQGQMKSFTRDPAALLKDIQKDSSLKLNEAQARVFCEVMASRDQIQGIQGFAGTGKTTALSELRKGLEKEGYTVRGFGTTGKNTNQLGETGMQVETLASHLQKGDKAHQTQGKVLYVLDESSMASANQVHKFLTELRDNERALLVGDTRQHQSVEWGKPFEQLQQAGMQTAELDKIVRQKNPALEEMVYRLERDDVAGAIQTGRENNVLVEEQDPQKRLDYLTDEALRYREMAQERRPGETEQQHESRQRIIIVTPENARKREYTETLRVKLQERGLIGPEDYKVKVLDPRQDVTKAQKAWAETYDVGDTVKYYRANKQLGIGKDDTARVIAKNPDNNTVTVEFEGGKKAGRQLTYDPSKGGNGVALYRESERTFSPGQDVQFTAKAKFGDVEVRNRDLGRFQSMDDQGNISIRHESGKTVKFNVADYRNLEQGGCYTSQIAQGQTAGFSGGDFGARNPDLVTFRATLITASRGQYECKIVAPDLSEMERLVKREISNETALPESRFRQIEQQQPRQLSAAAGRDAANKGRTQHYDFAEEMTAAYSRSPQPPTRQRSLSAEAQLRREFGFDFQSPAPVGRMAPPPPNVAQLDRQMQAANRSLSATVRRETSLNAQMQPAAGRGQQQVTPAQFVVGRGTQQNQVVQGQVAKQQPGQQIAPPTPGQGQGQGLGEGHGQGMGIEQGKGKAQQLEHSQGEGFEM